MAWLSGYSKRKELVLTGGASGALSDFQLSIAVSYEAAMQGDFDDIRFTQADGTTLVDACAEVIINGTSATVWVEFPSTPANTVEQDYYMYYGNGDAVSDWDGDATFEFFDNFESGACSGDAGWTYETGASLTKVSSPVKNRSCAGDFETTSDFVEAYTSVGSNISDRVFEFYARTPTNGAGQDQVIAIEKTGGDFTNAVYLVFRQGNIVYYDGSWHTLQAYSINTWYRFTVTTHPAADTFDIKIDDVSKGSGLGTRGSISGGINAFSLTGYDNLHLYVDMIFMRKYASGPPTYAFGSEESAGGMKNIFYGPFSGPLGGPI